MLSTSFKSIGVSQVSKLMKILSKRKFIKSFTPTGANIFLVPSDVSTIEILLIGGGGGGGGDADTGGGGGAGGIV